MLRAALDAVPDAVLVVNPDGVIQLANLQVRHVFGWEPGTLEGERVETLVPDAAREGHPRRRTDYNRRPMGLLQLSAQHRRGHVFPAEISLAPITLSGGEPLWTVATVRDITERLELEQQAEKVRDDVLANVTHELRTPLSSIVGYAELMDDLPPGELGDQARQMLDAIRRNAQRELGLVSDLLTVALSGAGRLAIAHHMIDLVSLTRQVVDEHTVTAHRSTISLRLEEPAHRPPQAACLVVGDLGRMRQVLDNILGNARKFSQPDAEVVVAWYPTDEHLCVSVADSGPGIPDDEQPHVFDRMFRGRAAIAGEIEGAGLGLAICRAIVEAHHGTITMQSSTSGTTVTIAFPLVRAAT
ncbi:Sensor protein DivL [Nocardioides sp. AX2bis]|nr:Sensor protein DivL [Nocardioides sp. AX2bis]